MQSGDGGAAVQDLVDTVSAEVFSSCKDGCCPLISSLGEISSDLYRFVQCDINKCAFDSLKMEQNPQNCD